MYPQSFVVIVLSLSGLKMGAVHAPPGSGTPNKPNRVNANPIVLKGRLESQKEMELKKTNTNERKKAKFKMHLTQLY